MNGNTISWFSRFKPRWRRSSQPSSRFRGWFLLVLMILLILAAIGIYWSAEPKSFDVRERAEANLPKAKAQNTVGIYTTSSLIAVMEVLLNKPGGYLSNDVSPASFFLDNIPYWELGALVQVQDMTRAMRNDFSRSQSQSTEDVDLNVAEPKFNFDKRSWMIPATESVYQEGVDALYRYLDRLQEPEDSKAQFYARADNLKEWLGQVEKRLGSLSQRLSASVGQSHLSTRTSEETEALQGDENKGVIQTRWFEVDNVFYEARGATWALIHFFKAVEIDFDSILQNKNALVSLRQIIRELEASQQTLWSPIIMNGSGFGLFANHSLVMGSYISRANAAVIDLRSLMEQG